MKILDRELLPNSLTLGTEIECIGDKSIVGINSPEELNKALNSIKKFKPKKFESNNDKFIKILENYIKE